MTVVIRVFKNAVAIQVGQGNVHWMYDWTMVLDFIREDDTVFVQDYTVM